MLQRIVTVMALGFLLCGLGSLGYTANVPTSIEVKTYQGIPYISGGVGEEERDMLRQVEGDYNVKLLFAVKEGNYLSDVNVTIEDSQGKKILAAVSLGPLFYTKLPPGKYKVMAQVRGQTHQQVAEVNQHKQTQLQFYW